MEQSDVSHSTEMGEQPPVSPSVAVEVFFSGFGVSGKLLSYKSGYFGSLSSSLSLETLRLKISHGNC